MKRRKKKTIKKLLSLRGGFATPRRVPSHISKPLQRELEKIASTNVSPERVSKFIDRLVDRAARGKSSFAVRMLKELAKPASIRISGKVLSLLDSPSEGISSTPGSPIPAMEEQSKSRISGRNSLYSMSEYKYNFSAGNSSGTWLRGIEKTNGLSIIKDVDSTENLKLDDANRSLLTVKGGANQKIQISMNLNYFGWTNQEIASHFSLSSLDTSQIRDQSAYGAIKKLNSKISFTSLNKYVPIFVKLYFLKQIIPNVTTSLAFQSCCNTDINTQENASMPRYWQQAVPSANSYYTYVYVDPKSRGVRGSDNFLTNFEVVKTKKFKLYAGDRLKVNYDHLFGSGVRLDSLYSFLKEAAIFTEATPITYNLMVEIWGEEVDVASINVPQNTIKATAPFAIQMEYSKTREGVRPLERAGDQLVSGSPGGWIVASYATKVYTKAPIDTTSRRWYDSYGNLDTTYYVPVMSDATAQSGGQI